MVEVPPAPLYECHLREGVSRHRSRDSVSLALRTKVSGHCAFCRTANPLAFLDEVWVRLEIAILTLMTRTITPLTCEFLSNRVLPFSMLILL